MIDFPSRVQTGKAFSAPCERDLGRHAGCEAHDPDVPTLSVPDLDRDARAVRRNPRTPVVPSLVGDRPGNALDGRP